MQDVTIDSTNLSVRTKNCLHRANIHYVSELLDCSEADLLQIQNIGEKSVQEVLEFQKMYTANPDLTNFSVMQNQRETALLEVVQNQCKETPPKNLLVIEVALPYIEERKILDIYFRLTDGSLVPDINISDINEFSIRTKNRTHNAGIDTVKSLAMMENDKLVHMRKMGAKSLSEIYEFLKSSAEIAFADEKEYTAIGKIVEFVQKSISLEQPLFDDHLLIHAIKQAIINNINKISRLESDDAESIVKSSIFKKIVGTSTEIKNVLANILYSIICKENQYVTFETLESRIPSILNYEGFTSDIISILVDQNKVEISADGCRVKRPTVADWVETLGDNQKNAILMRLNDKTLEECGQALDITRERVRQIISKAIRRKPNLREDDFAYWFQTYSLDKEAMEYLFGTTQETYAYYRMAYGHCGKQPISDMRNDSNMTGPIYSAYQQYETRNSIVIGNEYVPTNREILCRKLAQHICSETEMEFSQFYKQYMSLLESNGLADNKKLLFPSERAFEARVQDSMYVLYKYGHKLRYYPICEYDVEELVERLHFEQYQDVEISTRKVFVENSELMLEYNIQDEYELHNLLNKTKDQWNASEKYNLQITRMPFLVFGNADRARQAERLLYQVAPVTYEEFGLFYESEFGVKANTARANMGPLISKYYHNGVFSVDQPRLSDQERNYLLENLTADFYFISDVQTIYTDQFGDKNISRLNPLSYKELGFKVFCNYLIRNTFNSADHYFTYLFTKDDVLDMEKFDSRLIYVQSANQALDTLRSHYDILEYEDKKYISFNRFQSVVNGISKDVLKQYVEDAIKAAGNEDFFTVRTLKAKGFISELHNVGFGDWFNAGLIKNSKRIRYIRTADGFIFWKMNQQPTLLDFLTYVLRKIKKMDIYEFIDRISQDYGITLKKDKIIWLIKDSELYYDSNIKKIYLNKEFYYEDI